MEAGEIEAAEAGAGGIERACLRARVRACVRACVRMCVRACVRARACEAGRGLFARAARAVSLKRRYDERGSPGR
eukprot:3298746-Pleurochrysis_carterae.AAC.2